MGNPTTKELERAGIEFGAYRELASPATVGVAAARWPLIALTDQILVAERWKRQTLVQSARLPSNVTQIPTTRPAPMQTDWFHTHSAVPPVPPARSGT